MGVHFWDVQTMEDYSDSQVPGSVPSAERGSLLLELWTTQLKGAGRLSRW